METPDPIEKPPEKTPPPSVDDPNRPEACPRPNPIAPMGHSIAIRSVSFVTGQIVIQNVSAQPVTMQARTWQWCQFPAYWFVFDAPEGRLVLQPGDTIALFADEQGTSRRAMPASGEEMAIYLDEGIYDEASGMLAYVAWGTGTRQPPGREYVATMAGLWTAGDRVEITGRFTGGIMAVGDVTSAEGYAPVANGCLIYDASVRNDIYSSGNSSAK